MTDLDRYLTDEVLEKAAKAPAVGWDPERNPVLTAVFRDYARTALTAVLPGIIQKAKAEALRAYAGRVRSELDATALYGIPLGEKYLEGMYSALRQAEDAAAQYANERADQIAGDDS